jgi:hypothetical protein
VAHDDLVSLRWVLKSPSGAIKGTKMPKTLERVTQTKQGFARDVAAAKRLTLKAARTIIRLRYSSECDEQLARVIPEISAAFDAAVLAGREYTLDIAALLNETTPTKQNSNRAAIKGPSGAIKRRAA